MKKGIIISTMAVGAVLCQCISLAAPTGSYTAYQAVKAPTIDGSLDDWNLALYGQPTFILDPSASFVRAEPFSDPAENSAKVYMSYDEKNLYIGADVVDDALQGDGAREGIWGNTNMEVWLNGGDMTVPSEVAGAEPYEDEDFQVDLAVMSDGQRVPAQWVYSHDIQDAAGIKLAVKYKDYGYTLEAALPKAEFDGLKEFRAGGGYAMAISTVHLVDGVWSGLFSPGPKWEYAVMDIK